MSHVVDYFVVGLIVVCAAGYAATSLGPKSWRQSVLGGLAWAAGLVPRWFGLRRMSERMRLAATKSKSSCGGCDNCGSEAPNSAPPAGAEVKIRVGEIGRRVTH